MADPTDALFRIDPTAGLVDYVQAIKPYHTKVLEVLVEYIHTESINVTVLDRWSTRIGLARTNVDVGYFDQFATPPWSLITSNASADIIYACGYGHKWSEYGLVSPDANVVTQLISADVSTNTFLVAPVVTTPFPCTVINTQANQLMFADSHPITGVNPYTRTWVVAGDLSDSLIVGQSLYVSSNNGIGVNKRYTTQAVSYAGGVTSITVEESISLLATATGTINIATSFDSIPYWDAGMQVRLSSSGTIPPGVPSSRYYFVPTAEPGVFNLAIKRYPQTYEDFVDITGLETGTLTIERVEPFIPGQSITIVGSYLTRNDGTYNVGAITPEGANFRLTVIQTVPHSSPPGALMDGQVSLSINGYDQPAYCAVASAPDVHTEAYIHEVLKFAFELMPSDTISARMYENQPQGFGVMQWGDSPYGTYEDDQFPPSVPASMPSIHTLLPTGFGGQLFDTGPMDETLESATRLHGTTQYL